MLMTELFEEFINRILRFDPDTLARLAELQGKVIRLRASGDRPFEIFVLPDESGLRLHSRHDREPDVTLAGDIPVIFRFALRRIIPDVVAAGEVQISGDINLGQRFQRLLEQADIDWEEPAARVLGEDTAEYLQEESRLLPSRSRAEAFRQAVEALRWEAERLESRLERLREGVK